MSLRSARLTLMVAPLIALFGDAAWSQPLVNIETPVINVQEDFYERMGTNWGVRGGNWFFNWGGAPPVPAFGGYDPAAQLQGGIALAAPGFGAHFGFTAGQGNTRTITGVAPNVTVMNGGYGYVFDGQTRPFVTQIIPVVAESPIDRHIRLHGVPKVPSSVSSGDEELPVRAAPQERVQSAPAGGPSSAERGERSVAAIRREQELQAAAEQEEFSALLAEAEAKVEAQEFTAAAVLYTKAAVRSQGTDREHYLARAKELRLRAKQIR